MLLKDRVVLITGAARGIGLATSGLFALHGANVIMTGRNLSLLENARQKLLEENTTANISSLLCDVADDSSVRDAFQTVFKEFKRLDVLVSNAGILEDALIGMVSAEQIQRVFQTNTYGVLYCAQYAARMMARNKAGSIVNVSSIIGTNGGVGQAVYAGSKAAVIGITKSLAKELAPGNIRVNAIAPGFIDTDMAHSISSEKFQERIDSVQMGRIGSPNEVAQVALFLASDLASYVTGQTVGVDGGMLI
jgi:3-oxoacyl-[acyl-carrier protein] reductase